MRLQGAVDGVMEREVELAWSASPVCRRSRCERCFRVRDRASHISRDFGHFVNLWL